MQTRHASSPPNSTVSLAWHVMSTSVCSSIFFTASTTCNQASDSGAKKPPFYFPGKHGYPSARPSRTYSHKPLHVIEQADVDFNVRAVHWLRFTHTIFYITPLIFKDLLSAIVQVIFCLNP